MQLICPRCQKRIITDPNCDDVQHECNSGNATLDNEDVTVIGDWEDYTGSGTPQNILLQGIQNKLFGTRAAIEGEDSETMSNRGNRASTRRVRQHIEHINLDGGN